MRQARSGIQHNAIRIFNVVLMRPVHGGTEPFGGLQSNGTDPRFLRHNLQIQIILDKVAEQREPAHIEKHEKQLERGGRETDDVARSQKLVTDHRLRGVDKIGALPQTLDAFRVLRLVFLSMRVEKFCSAGGELFAQKKQEGMDVQGPTARKNYESETKIRKYWKCSGQAQTRCESILTEADAALLGTCRDRFGSSRGGHGSVQ